MAGPSGTDGGERPTQSTLEPDPLCSLLTPDVSGITGNRSPSEACQRNCPARHDDRLTIVVYVFFVI